MTRKLVTLYGNVGRDPETKTFPGQERDIEFYDPVIDDLVERTITTEEREVTRFSIAINAKDENDEELVRWINCDDWKGQAKAAVVRKGDRVKVRGYFKERTYEKDGETKVFRFFVVEELGIERRRKAPEAA